MHSLVLRRLVRPAFFASGKQIGSSAVTTSNQQISHVDSTVSAAREISHKKYPIYYRLASSTLLIVIWF